MHYTSATLKPLLRLVPDVEFLFQSDAILDNGNTATGLVTGFLVDFDSDG